MSARSRRGRPLALLRSSWHCGRALDPRSRVLVPLFSITHSRSATATLSTAPCCQCPSARHLADHLWHLRFLPFLLPLTCPRPPAYTEPQRHVNGGKVRLCSACKLVPAPAIRTETPERVADALHPPPTAYPRHCRSLPTPCGVKSQQQFGISACRTPRLVFHTRRIVKCLPGRAFPKSTDPLFPF